MGPQFRTSRQSPNVYFFLSRIHPESVRPLTCTAWWPRVCNCSATWSTFTKTPMPPALKKKREVKGGQGGKHQIHTSSACNVTAHGADLLPARIRTSALSKPLASSSCTTSLMITAPRNAKSSENSRSTPRTAYYWCCKPYACMVMLKYKYNFFRRWKVRGHDKCLNPSGCHDITVSHSLVVSACK